MHSIFFPEKSQLQSVLLKRGTVLLRGEERELMVFTYGFLFSRVEVDTLINLLLDTGPGENELDMERWEERFRDLDTGHSGCK